MQFLFCSPSAQQQNTHFNKSECFMEGREEGISARYHLVKRVSGCAGRRCVPGNDAQNTVSPILFGELKGINAALFFTASKINSCLQKLHRSWTFRVKKDNLPGQPYWSSKYTKWYWLCVCVCLLTRKSCYFITIIWNYFAQSIFILLFPDLSGPD